MRDSCFFFNKIANYIKSTSGKGFAIFTVESNKEIESVIKSIYYVADGSM